MFPDIDVAEDLRLTKIQANDSIRLFSLVDSNRNYLREWLPWVDFNTTENDSKEFIARSEKLADEKKGVVYGIRHNADLVGIIGFNYIDYFHRICEIGYWLDAQCQGQGIVSRSTEALIEFAFEDLDMNKVCIPVATENSSSRAIPERLGCSIEGTSREAEWLYDHFVDHVLYSLLRSEWKSGDA